MIRIARIGAGLTLVMLGLFLLFLPGPGVLTIAGGLAVLAPEFAWARKLLDWMRRTLREQVTHNSTSATPEDAADESAS